MKNKKVKNASEYAQSLMDEYDYWATALAETVLEYNLTENEKRIVDAMAEDDF